MTAQVSIEVERLDSALQIPVQAVLERSKRFFCIVENLGEIAAREVKVGSANDQSVVVSDGLDEGEQVILAPQSYESKVTLPEPTVKTDSIKGRKALEVADNTSVNR